MNNKGMLGIPCRAILIHCISALFLTVTFDNIRWCLIFLILYLGNRILKYYLVILAIAKKLVCKYFSNYQVSIFEKYKKENKAIHDTNPKSSR